MRTLQQITNRTQTHLGDWCVDAGSRHAASMFGAVVAKIRPCGASGGLSGEDKT